MTAGAAATAVVAAEYAAAWTWGEDTKARASGEAASACASGDVATVSAAGAAAKRLGLAAGRSPKEYGEGLDGGGVERGGLERGAGCDR